MRPSNKVKFALLGCSRISFKHIEALDKLKKRCSLVDICDSNKDALTNTSQITDSNIYEKYEDMLNRTDADFIIITTPNGLHHEHTIQAAEAGFNVIVEKPMAISVSQAKEMITVCEKNNVKLYVVKQVRFADSIKLLKKAIHEKRFGQIFLINLNIFWTRPQSFYDSSPWKGDKKLDGGSLLNQASHYIDLLEWIFGPINSVNSITDTLYRKIQVEDTSVANFRWKSGAIGSMAFTLLTYPKNLECSLTIIGENGTAKLEGPSLNYFSEWKFLKEKPYDKKIPKNKSNITKFSHYPFYENLLDAHKSKHSIVLDGHQGLKSLKVIEAIYKSSKDNKTIKII